MREQLLQRISVNPDVCFGKPCIRGYRNRASLLIELPANGATFEEILEDYPFLERDDIPACIAYGSEITSERHVDVPSAA